MASRCQCLQVLRQTFALYPASSLCHYLGQHYTYDARGNLLERLDNGKKARFTWDLYDRLTRYEDDRLTADFAYDALGRRVAKYSKAHCPPSPGAGPAWIEQQQRTLNAQYDCGQNIYGWDGDILAYDTRYSDNPGERRLIHYFYEPGSFIPVAQTVENRNLSLVREPSHENGYHIDRDPLWQHQPVAKPFNAIAWYQCDHLGTPMELTDQRGEIALCATYQAWGLAKEKRTDNAIRENIRNPLRFQGQYFDTKTGLHYNRYRYYDPQVGRFISKDPIGFAGGLNVYAYAPNPVGWVDPFGLARIPKSVKQKISDENRDFFGVETCESCISAVVPGQKSTKGISPPSNERQFDHIEADSRGGSNDENNTQILCRKCNRGFSNNSKPNFRILNRIDGTQ